MDYHLKNIIKEIKSGKNLEKAIPQYTERFFQTYAQMAVIHLTMDYYMLYEMIKEKEGKEYSEIQGMLGEINQVISSIFIEEINENEGNIKILDNFRNDVIKKMKIITTYTDKLQIYEHVLNRIELKYEQNLVLSNQRYFIQKTLQYILGSDSNMIINARIKEVIAELPVRMAKGKYYQLIKNSFGLFKGAEKSALDSFLFHLESAAMLYEPEGMTEHFSNLREFVLELEQIQFQELQKEEYQVLKEKFAKYADFCVEVSEQYFEIEGIINHLYSYVLFLQFSRMEENKETMACIEILRTVCQKFKENKKETIPKEIEDKFIDIEGKQEELADDCEQLESVLYEIRTAKKDFMKQIQFEEKIETLYQMEQLMGNSRFVEFSEENIEANTEKVSEEQLETVTKEFLNKISELFKNNQKCINRAVMASTFMQMPSFFHTTEEVSEYVEQSLEQCTDAAERQASMNIIYEMMEELV